MDSAPQKHMAGGTIHVEHPEPSRLSKFLHAAKFHVSGSSTTECKVQTRWSFKFISWSEIPEKKNSFFLQTAGYSLWENKKIPFMADIHLNFSDLTCSVRKRHCDPVHSELNDFTITYIGTMKITSTNHIEIRAGPGESKIHLFLEMIPMQIGAPNSLQLAIDGYFGDEQSYESDADEA
jgi:hypothetical protein